MNFGEALDLIKSGYKLQRSEWNYKNEFIYLVRGSTFEVNRPPLNAIFEDGYKASYRSHIDIKYQDDSMGCWVASQTDMLAEDWEIFQK